MNVPEVLVKEANDNLDTLGHALTAGATIAPDFAMRAVIAMRDRLNRHQGYRSNGAQICAYCERSWPCPDIRSDFGVIGVDVSDDED